MLCNKRKLFLVVVLLPGYIICMYIGYAEL